MPEYVLVNGVIQHYWTRWLYLGIGVSSNALNPWLAIKHASAQWLLRPIGLQLLSMKCSPSWGTHRQYWLLNLSLRKLQHEPRSWNPFQFSAWNYRPRQSVSLYKLIDLLILVSVTPGSGEDNDTVGYKAVVKRRDNTNLNSDASKRQREITGCM